MAAKVRWMREAWWVVTHFEGRRRKKRIGPTKADKRRAVEIARKIDGALALGTFAPEQERPDAIPLDAHLRKWHARYGPTFKTSYEETSRGLVENHLAPFFRGRDLRELREEHLLDYVRAKLDAGQGPATVLNALSILRRVCNLAVRDELLTRNPASRLGEIMRRVDRRSASEVRRADAWSEAEVQKLLAVAREHEPRFYPALLFLLSTGTRRGELLGLKWEDVDFERCRVTIRRAIVRGQPTTPKSGKSRTIAIPPGLASALLDVLGERRKQALRWRWPEVPPWVFCAEPETVEGRKLEGGGGPIEERNFERSWQRVRRRAQKQGVRPLKLHCARHTYASRALAAGKSVRWVAEQLGHANPELTLRTYAHVLPDREEDLSFADFVGVSDAPGRPQTAPHSDAAPEAESAPDATARERSRNLERETGVEPATLSLGKRRKA